jgi:lipid II:glycine glycyltransferase (peptidoglycan interpeptide bridge formation enzyme)
VRRRVPRRFRAAARGYLARMDDQRRSEQLEQETEDLEREGERAEGELKDQGDKLERDIERTREDWERKQEDSAVPGATGDALTGSDNQPAAGDDEHRVPDGPG